MRFLHGDATVGGNPVYVIEYEGTRDTTEEYTEIETVVVDVDAVIGEEEYEVVSSVDVETEVEVEIDETVDVVTQVPVTVAGTATATATATRTKIAD